MELAQVFLEMLQYPNSPKVYRAIRDLYRQMGRPHESKAFSHLLEVKFNELPEDNNPDTRQKP
jgi:hypothetical protein